MGPKTGARLLVHASDENALRLLQSWCNYDDFRISQATARKVTISDAPRCIALRSWEAEQQRAGATIAKP